MGKYTKMALVLLYLLQLVVVFREQLVHLYKSALESVHHKAEHAAQPIEPGGLRKVLGRVIEAAQHPAAAHAITVTVIAAPAVYIHENHGHPHNPHPDPEDEKKDRARKGKKAPEREWLVRNLYLFIRRAAPPPSASDKRASDIVRMLTFSCSSQPAA
jgi:hypothetical protein